jgi:hypothetical protein
MATHKIEFAISYEENLDNAESLAVLSGINLYLDVPKALLKVLKHFFSAIRSLINSPSKPCRLEGQVAKGAFAPVRLKPFDSLLDLLATFRARNFQRQIVEKHSLVYT